MAVTGCGMFPCTDGEIYVHANVGMIASSWHNIVKWMREEGIPGAEELGEPRWSDPAWAGTEEARRIAAEAIAQLTRTRTKNQVYDQLQQRRILSAPMSHVSDLFDNAQLKFLAWFTEQSHGARRATWPGPAFRMSETPRLPPGLAPRVGEHTAEVAAQLPAASATATKTGVPA
jgi:benzylsuccinate CoA-transferase BbsE subunit